MDNNQKQIVIIEDDAVLRRGLKRLFDNENYLVLDFGNAKSAIAQIQKVFPDIVLCDYKLPDLNGLEVLKFIRKSDQKTPFFLMTGYYKDDIFRSATANGANEVLEKPLDLKMLKSICRSAFKP